MTNSGSSPERSRDGALQQRRLSGAGRADEIERHDFATREPCPAFGGDRVVLRENARLQVEASMGILVRADRDRCDRAHARGCDHARAHAIMPMMMLIMRVMMLAMKMTVAMVPMRMGRAVYARAAPRSPRARRSADWSSWSPALGSRSSCTLCSLLDFDAFDVQLFAAQALKLARAAWTRREHVGRGKLRAADVAARLGCRLRGCPASRLQPACLGRLPENRTRRPAARRPTICRSRASRGARCALARPATPIRRCCKRSRVRARRLL